MRAHMLTHTIAQVILTQCWSVLASVRYKAGMVLKEDDDTTDRELIITSATPGEIDNFFLIALSTICSHLAISKRPPNQSFWHSSG